MIRGKEAKLDKKGKFFHTFSYFLPQTLIYFSPVREYNPMIQAYITSKEKIIYKREKGVNYF